MGGRGTLEQKVGGLGISDIERRQFLSIFDRFREGNAVAELLIKRAKSIKKETMINDSTRVDLPFFAENDRQGSPYVFSLTFFPILSQLDVGCEIILGEKKLHKSRLNDIWDMGVNPQGAIRFNSLKGPIHNMAITSSGEIVVW